MRFTPLELAESAQLRLQRLYDKAHYKPAVSTMSVPRPKGVRQARRLVRAGCRSAASRCATSRCWRGPARCSPRRDRALTEREARETETGSCFAGASPPTLGWDGADAGGRRRVPVHGDADPAHAHPQGGAARDPGAVRLRPVQHASSMARLHRLPPLLRRALPVPFWLNHPMWIADRPIDPARHLFHQHVRGAGRRWPSSRT